MSERSSNQPRKGSQSPRRQNGGSSSSRGGRSGGSQNRDQKAGGSRSSSGDSRSGKSQGRSKGSGAKGSGGSSRQQSSYRSGDRRGSQSGRPPSSRSREQLRTAGSGGGDLPNWIKEEVARTTPKEKRPIVLGLLSEAADAFAAGRYPRAHQILLRAKKETTRVATVRELLGLTAYRMGRWDEALKELRTYRRIDGDTSHMPVEMDCQRALGRPQDVEKTWERYNELGGQASTDAESKVVYGAFLLDEGRGREAWKVVNPGRISQNPKEWDLRQWYVAARVAARLGDGHTARQLLGAIERHELAFPGLDVVRDELAALDQ